MLKADSQRGFSIIELATALTIIALLLTLGMPSLSEYVQNARLGTAAQSFVNGLNLARSEAIRRNAPVEFMVTGNAIVAGVENTASASGSGTNWVVRYQVAGSGPYFPVEAKSMLDGGGAAPSVTVGASDPIVTFNSLGGTTTGLINGGTAITLKNPPMGLCAPAGPVRCWTVVVRPGGQVHLCDPAAVVGDSRAC